MLLLVLLLPFVAQAYNYLVYSPIFGHSHDNFLGKLADTLTDAGHNVTYLAPIGNYRLSGRVSVKSTKDLFTIDADDYLINLQNQIENTDVGDFWTQYADIFSQDKMVQSFLAMYYHQCVLVSRNETLKAELKRRHFDVMIFEPFNNCAYVLRDFLNITTFIPATSLMFDEYVAGYNGEPFPLSISPITVSLQSDRMGFFGRLWNVVEYAKVLRNEWDRVPDECFDNFGVKPYNFRLTIKDSSFIFVNSNPYLSFPRPILPKTIPIGGIVVDVEKLKAQKVDPEWDEILNRRQKSVLLSFGSMILSSVMPLSYKQNLIKVFLSMPDVTFIWKYEEDDVAWAGNASNVHFSKWVPQTALLADSRLTVFITHGGLGSTTELAYLGKPSLMIPMFGDQMRNAKMMERYGAVKVLSKTLLGDFESVRSALHDVIFDENFKKAAQILGEQLENQPMKPKETVIRHAEFAARFPHLSRTINAASIELNFFQYYLIDVLLFVVAVIASIIYLLIVILRLFRRKLKQE